MQFHVNTYGRKTEEEIYRGKKAATCGPTGLLSLVYIVQECAFSGKLISQIFMRKPTCDSNNSSMELHSEGCKTHYLMRWGQSGQIYHIFSRWSKCFILPDLYSFQSCTAIVFKKDNLINKARRTQIIGCGRVFEKLTIK